jgi:hypothetical protein
MDIRTVGAQAGSVVHNLSVAPPKRRPFEEPAVTRRPEMAFSAKRKELLAEIAEIRRLQM